MGCPQARGWQASLELGLSPAGTRTRLSHQRHSGPLRVQRPFVVPGDPALHVYLLHPPGGVVGGDGLRLRVAVAGGARGLLTTPSAGRFYRSGGDTAVVSQELEAAAGAGLEWLPQENILFSGARVQSRTRVHLATGSRFLGWEINCLGRPAAGETFADGWIDQQMELWRDGLPLLLERCRLTAGEALLDRPWGLAEMPVYGLMLATPLGDEGLQTVREELSAWPGRLAATLRKDVLAVRYRGPCAAQARAAFTACWGLLRPRLMGAPAMAPRIWAT